MLCLLFSQMRYTDLSHLGKSGKHAQETVNNVTVSILQAGGPSGVRR